MASIIGSVARYAGQGVLYILFALPIGYFSEFPSYTHFDPDKALIKISISHVGTRKGVCHEGKAQAFLPRANPNTQSAQSRRRAFQKCPRERNPVTLEMWIDGKLAYRAEKPPTGLSKDGPSVFYHRVAVAAGPHRIEVRLNDRGPGQKFDYVGKTKVDLAPGRSFVIDFREENRKFLFL